MLHNYAQELLLHNKKEIETEMQRMGNKSFKKPPRIEDRRHAGHARAHTRPSQRKNGETASTK